MTNDLITGTVLNQVGHTTRSHVTTVWVGWIDWGSIVNIFHEEHGISIEALLRWVVVFGTDRKFEVTLVIGRDGDFDFDDISFIVNGLCVPRHRITIYSHVIVGVVLVGLVDSKHAARPVFISSSLISVMVVFWLWEKVITFIYLPCSLPVFVRVPEDTQSKVSLKDYCLSDCVGLPLTTGRVGQCGVTLDSGDDGREEDEEVTGHYADRFLEL